MIACFAVVNHITTTTNRPWKNKQTKWIEIYQSQPMDTTFRNCWSEFLFPETSLKMIWWQWKIQPLIQQSSHVIERCSIKGPFKLPSIYMHMTSLYYIVPSAPQCLRVLNKSTSQIKIIWEPPATSNGVLKGYQIVVRGNIWYLCVIILSENNKFNWSLLMWTLMWKKTQGDET